MRPISFLNLQRVYYPQSIMMSDATPRKLSQSPRLVAFISFFTLHIGTRCIRIYSIWNRRRLSFYSVFMAHEQYFPTNRPRGLVHRNRLVEELWCFEEKYKYRNVSDYKSNVYHPIYSVTTKGLWAKEFFDEIQMCYLYRRPSVVLGAVFLVKETNKLEDSFVKKTYWKKAKFIENGSVLNEWVTFVAKLLTDLWKLKSFSNFKKTFQFLEMIYEFFY